MDLARRCFRDGRALGSRVREDRPEQAVKVGKGIVPGMSPGKGGTARTMSRPASSPRRLSACSVVQESGRSGET